MNEETLSTLLNTYWPKLSFWFRDFWGESYVRIECPQSSPNGIQTKVDGLDTNRVKERIARYIDSNLSYTGSIAEVNNI